MAVAKGMLNRKHLKFHPCEHLDPELGLRDARREIRRVLTRQHEASRRSRGWPASAARMWEARMRCRVLAMRSRSARSGLFAHEAFEGGIGVTDVELRRAGVVAGKLDDLARGPTSSALQRDCHCAAASWRPEAKEKSSHRRSSQVDEYHWRGGRHAMMMMRSI